ncbi:zf-C2H2 jaz and zf-met domain containing protein [Trichuris trichiura]|uniref:Zf-C2H2 jaz and zf-met domain containing protein n=1 Tax=Trichuris trichiura TaxID=36087 RepID=A0A077ZFL7_TRITR|nr:zf-C2H2 jaz and zf-met domain containing protein [Trichuris trichiura]
MCNIFSAFGSTNQEHSYPGRGSSMFRTSYGRPLAGSGYDTAFRGSLGTFSRSARALSGSRGAAQARNRSTLFCELCKVSCVGQQAYDEHVKGQRHAKRETQAKVVSAAADGKGNSKTLHHCKICNIFCTGTETLKAHQRGVKHQRVCRIYKTVNEKEVCTTQEMEPAKVDTEESAKGDRISWLFFNDIVIVSPGEEQGDAKANTEVAVISLLAVMDTSAPLEKEAEVVGEEYLTLIPATKNKAAQFRCSLCNCEFSDLQAKETHLKGRRHRINFKVAFWYVRIANRICGNCRKRWKRKGTNVCLLKRQMTDHELALKLKLLESAKANSKHFFVKIIRVDDLAKGIAIRGENHGEIVAICPEMPTCDTFYAIEQHLASKIEVYSCHFICFVVLFV